MKVYLSIDIGGTKTAVAVYKEDGNEIFYTKFSTEAEKGFRFLLNEIKRITKNFLADKELVAGCIACPGPLDVPNGKIVFIATMGWKNIPIVKEFEKAFGVKFYLLNDCTSGAYGCYIENNCPKNILYVSISTGIGGGLILNNQLYEGNGQAAEVGHMRVNGIGRKCPCGRTDCLELYASGSGISQLYYERTNERLTTPQIAQAAMHGNIIAIELFNQAGNYLLDVLQQIETLLDVDLIVFGGGLIQSQSLFLPKVIKELKTKCVLANNDGKQVIKGAYYYLMKRLKEDK